MMRRFEPRTAHQRRQAWMLRALGAWSWALLRLKVRWLFLSERALWASAQARARWVRALTIWRVNVLARWVRLLVAERRRVLGRRP